MKSPPPPKSNYLTEGLIGMYSEVRTGDLTNGPPTDSRVKVELGNGCQV